MTTAVQQVATTGPKLAGSQYSGTVAIPLAEFGKSLTDADLDVWFEAFSERNSNEGQTYEISGKGFLLIMPPTGNPGSLHEREFAGVLYVWTTEHDGYSFLPTSRFILPDGSRFGPDAAWIREERIPELLEERNIPFPHLVPDFVVEIKSPSNSNTELINKIDLFLEYGTRLAWFIDAATRTVIKFRPGQEPEVLHDPELVDGDEDVLPGFRFAVREKIFDHFTNPQ